MRRQAMTNIRRCPRMFYDDHNSRDLPAPDPVKESKRFVWLDLDHKDMPELISDAKHYAWGGWDREDEGMMTYQAGARRLLEALGQSYEAKVAKPKGWQ